MTISPFNQQTLLPAKDIVCYWNTNAAGKICDFTVSDDDSLSQEQWQCCRGKCDAGWASSNTTPTQRGDFMSTPTLLFGEMVFTQEFANGYELRRAILALARIQECQWARELASFWWEE